MNLKKIGLGLLALSLFAGCSAKKDLTNQTALFWHNAIYKDITTLNIDKADDDFTSLEVEHPNSIYIPTDLLVLAKTHLKNEEYQLASFYIDEYEKRYANRYEKEWCEYTKVKIEFFSLTNPYTNQKKITTTLALVNRVLNTYPNSIYKYELNTIRKKLELTQIVFDNNIANLYKRLDKPKAAKIYERNSTEPIIPPHIPWYKKIFYW
jgi:outer membrane protein assembly factor BamD